MIQAPVSHIKNLFLGRTVAYNRVFDMKSPYTQQVLIDLCKFCRMHDTTFHTDPRVHALLEGRREVILRIMEALNLSIEEIYACHKIKDQTLDKS